MASIFPVLFSLVDAGASVAGLFHIRPILSAAKMSILCEKFVANAKQTVQAINLLHIVNILNLCSRILTK